MQTRQTSSPITGNVLKMLAIITMLIDHATVVFVENHLFQIVNRSYIGGTDLNYTAKEFNLVSNAQLIGRGIGRIAFPIFLFLLLEGFLHTRNVWKYALRLGLFALISEVPYDLVFTGSFFDLSKQNVFFTLLLALLMMIGFDLVSEKFNKKAAVIALQAGILLAALIVSVLIQSDYTCMGIAMAAAIYLTRNNRKYMWLAVLAAMIITLIPARSSVLEVIGCLAFIPIAFYNGERGSFNLKYFFYAFYPLHLLVLGLIQIYVLK